MALIALQAIAANVLVIAAAFGYGSWIPQFLPEQFSRFTRLVCVVIGGFGLLGLTVFLVGQISLNRWTIGAILAAGVVFTFASKLRPWRMRVPIAGFPTAIVCAMLLWTAVAGLAEPVGDWGKDGVAYHLVGPKVWLRNGVIRPIADSSVTSYPATAEMVFTGLRAFGGDRAPGFSAFWTMAMFLGIAASLGRRCGLDAKAAWWIAALAITMPAIYNGGFFAFVDVIYAAFVLAAVRVGFDATQRRHFALFGFFCGLAMATKYPGLLALPVLIFWAVWRREELGSFGEAARKSLVTVAVACLVASPFYLRNWILLGAPIYPPPAWVTNFSHVKYLSSDALQRFYGWSVARGRGHGHGILQFLALPFNLTYHSADFSGAGGIGITPLAFGPIGLLAAWRERFSRRMVLAGFLLLVLWFVTMQESRYLIHVYTLGAIFAVLGWQEIVPLTGRRGRLLCAAAVALSMLYGIYIIGKFQFPASRSVFSTQRASEWRRERAVFTEGFDYINHTDEVRRVLILDRSVPTYYSDKDYVKPFGQWGERPYPGVNTVADILPRVIQMGITHVFDVQSEIAGYQVPSEYPGLVLAFEASGQRVYQVVSRK